MSETTEPTTGVPSTPEAGFWTTLGNVFLAPGDAFRTIARRPDWLLPMLLSVGVSLGFTAVYLAKADSLEVTRARIEASPRAARMDPGQREAAIAMQAKILKPAGWVLAVVGSPAWFALSGLYFMVVFRFFYGATLSFRQAFSVSAFVNLATGFVQSLLMLVTFLLKGDWNIPPELVLQTSPALLLDRAAAAPWVVALLSSLDLFTLWRLALFAIGFGILTRRSTGSAAWAGIVPWIVFSLLGVGAAALFA
jgi:hypothetical protein